MADINPWMIGVPIVIVVLVAAWMASFSFSSVSRQLDFWSAAPAALISIVCIPLCAYCAFQQWGARDRLRHWGLPVSPEFRHCEGAQGGRAPRHVWRFSLESGAADPLSTYARQAEGSGWSVSFAKNRAATLSKNGVRFSVSRDRESMVIQKLK